MHDVMIFSGRILKVQSRYIYGIKVMKILRSFLECKTSGREQLTIFHVTWTGVNPFAISHNSIHYHEATENFMFN